MCHHLRAAAVLSWQRAIPLELALSGDPEDIRKTDAKMKELFPQDAHLHRWLDMAADRIAFQGLPARICWIGLELSVTARVWQ